MSWEEAEKEKLRAFANKTGVSTSLNAAQVLANVKKRTPSRKPEQVKTEVVKTLYMDRTTLVGRIISVENYRVHIALEKGKTLSCTTSVAIASSLRSKVGQKMAFRGKGTRDKGDGRFLNFVIQSIVEVEEMDPDSALDKHIARLGKALPPSS